MTEEIVNKRCLKCNEYKSLDDFYTTRFVKSGKTGNCKQCLAIQAREYRRNNPEVFKKRFEKQRLRYRYGLSVEDFNALLEKQNYVCALCKKPPTTKCLQIDHCHKTGRIRGILCNSCNSALGRLGDSIEGLMKVIAYLNAVEGESCEIIGDRCLPKIEHGQHSYRGENVRTAKLNEGNIREIRWRYQYGEKQTYLAKEFNVTQSAIQSITSGKSWTHIQ